MFENFPSLLFLIKSLSYGKVASSVRNSTVLMLSKNMLSTNDANDTIYFLTMNSVQSEND